MKRMKRPEIIEFPKIGRSDVGYLSVAEAQRSIPFEIERMYWIYFTPDQVVRGRHAHISNEQVLVAVAGKVLVQTVMPDGEEKTHELSDPSKGLYLPPEAWHSMSYSHDAVQLVFASDYYDPKDYVYEKPV